MHFDRGGAALRRVQLRQGPRCAISRASVVGLEGRAARAYGAQLNGFETFPLFAAAVIVSHVVGGPSLTANVLAVVYVLLRIGHMAAYIGGRQPLRSAAFTAAQLVAAAIFILCAFR